jgi:hypothetical protein
VGIFVVGLYALNSLYILSLLTFRHWIVSHFSKKTFLIVRTSWLLVFEFNGSSSVILAAAFIEALKLLRKKTF